MTRVVLQAVFWLVIYLAIALVPLGLLFIGAMPAGRGFWVEFSLALGFIGFAMMVGQFALTGRFRSIGAPFGLDTLLNFHRQAGLVAACFILAHPIIAIIANPAYISFFDPRVNGPRAVALSLVTIALIALIVATLFRQQLRLYYEWWRLTHGLLAVFIVIVGVGHMFMVGQYLSTLWKQAIWTLLTGTAILQIVYTRIIKPMLIRKRPYRVADVRKELGSCWTVALEPVNHSGMRFNPGQFAWVTFGGAVYTLQQHPFSFSSSAAATQRIEFTIKALGDFTAQIGSIDVDTTAYLEGPYGGFTLRGDEPGAVFVAGGIGITPIMSILRTARDRNDRRRFFLLYGSSDWGRTIFRDQLAALAKEINLTLVHILEKPHESWPGERGFITEDVITRHVPADALRDYPCFICGPEPMMDAVEPAVRRLGVPSHHLRSERFKIV